MNLTETLQQTLINLSLNDAAHYETVATQIRETRTAILIAGGVDLSKMDEVNDRLAALEKIETAIATKRQVLANYDVLISQARTELKDVYSQVEAQNKKINGRAPKAVKQ